MPLSELVADEATQLMLKGLHTLQTQSFAPAQHSVQPFD
jgi:hypothetical protein